MNRYLPMLVSLSENEKRIILIVFVIFTFAFLLVGLLVKGIRSWSENKGKAVDGYMYDFVKFRVIKTPAEFRRYVSKRETRYLYLNSRWMLRILIITSILFVIFVETSLDGNYKECLDIIDRLFPVLDWPKTEIFGMQIICDWPTLVREPSAELTLKGYVTYIYSLILIYCLFKFIHDILIFSGRISRANKVSNSAFGKNLDDGVDRINE